MRYIIVGGRPFSHHMNRGTVTFSSLKVVGGSDTIEGVKRIWTDKYEECGGLMLVVDTTTGLEAEIHETRSDVGLPSQTFGPA